MLAVVAAMGLGLALTTSLEPLAAANFWTNRCVRLAAEAGTAVAVQELGGLADWNLVLTGLAVSSTLEHGEVDVELPDGTRAGLEELTARATCGRPGPCTDAERAAFTAARPWGPNNPRWTVFGHGRLDQTVPDGAGLPPVRVVVWVADDPAELDGDPLTDSGTGPGGGWRPGGGVVAVRAEAFGPRSAHATVVATVARPSPDLSAGARLVSMRGLH